MSRISSDLSYYRERPAGKEFRGNTGPKHVAFSLACLYIYVDIQGCTHSYTHMYTGDLHKYLLKYRLGRCGTLHVHIYNIMYDVLQILYHICNVFYPPSLASSQIYLHQYFSENWALSKICFVDGLNSVWGMVPHSSRQIESEGESQPAACLFLCTEV